MMMKTLWASFILMSLLLGAGARADKMDSETQNQVIERLDRILSRMAKSDSSWAPSQLRLADLLAERARLRFMNEIEAGCKGCKGSDADRKRALGIYDGILSKLSREDQGIVLFQMAHLHQIFGDNKKAEGLFEGILKNSKNSSKDLLTRTHTALGDLLFQDGKMQPALAHYEIAFRDPKASNRGLIMYRMAWCHFNLDRLSKGIATLEKLAKSPSLLVKELPEGNQPDPAFKNDVLRDLATFYARQKVSSKDIRTFIALTPMDQRKELLSFFGDEADRLGQKQAASEIYHAYLALPDLTKEEKLEAYVRLAQINYDKGQNGESLKAFATAAQAFKSVKCAEDVKCVELQKRMKRYVTELHRSKKVNPDQGVLEAYALYAKTFPDDTEMALLGAQVAVQLKNPAMAAVLYRQASASAQDPKLRESALLGEIESAEKSGNLEARRSAYLHYLDLNPRGPKAFEVRYQLAHIDYEKKQWAKASSEFRDLALDKSGPADLRKKAADLALDGLASEKRDADIEKWSAEFAQAFPANRDEFLQISRKAVINQTARTANDGGASKSELRTALEKMQATNLKGASLQEKLVHYHNEAVLAEKIGDDVALVAALNALLDLKSTSAPEREQLLARKVAVYERRLDFKSAYQIALQMKFPKLSAAERELRLGTLADLAGFPPQRHYESALARGLRGERASQVRARLVLLAKSPLRELARQKNDLARDPKLFSDTILIVYGRTHDAAGLEKYLKGSMSRSVAAQFIHKQPFYPRVRALDRRLAAHALGTSSERVIQRSLQERMGLLKQADALLNESVRLQDFTAQVLALNIVNRENDRIVKDLFALPMPKGLKEREQQQYTSLLKQQARPFLYKAKVAGQKLSEFWANAKALARLTDDYRKARPELRNLVGQELRDLAPIAPGSVRSRLESALRESDPSSRDLLSAREAVRMHPADAGEIEKLKTLETKIGHPLMSSYLEGRLEQIQKGTVL